MHKEEENFTMFDKFVIKKKVSFSLLWCCCKFKMYTRYVVNYLNKQQRKKL